MIREAFDYKVETGTGKRNFTRPRRWRSCRRRVKKLIHCSAGLRCHAYTGCRIGELLGSAATAIQQREGIWCLAIQERRTPASR